METTQRKEIIMFKNIGGKIELLTKVLFWFGVIISILIGLGIASGYRSGGFIVFIICAGLGILISWLSVFLLNGFGHLISTVDEINKKLGSKSAPTVTDTTGKQET